MKQETEAARILAKAGRQEGQRGKEEMEMLGALRITKRPATLETVHEG